MPVLLLSEALEKIEEKSLSRSFHLSGAQEEIEEKSQAYLKPFVPPTAKDGLLKHGNSFLMKGFFTNIFEREREI